MDSIRYVLKKLERIWPIHLLAFLICLKATMPNKDVAIIAVLNLTLLQAWSKSSEVYFAFNGATWYLSALLFCYFCSELYLTVIRTRKSAVVGFTVLAVIRVGLEVLQKRTGGNYISLDIHVNPFIRCLEYGMGICMAPIFIALRDKHPKNTTVFCIATVFEAAALGGYTHLIYQNNLLRGQYVLLACGLVFIIGFGNGFIGKILGCQARPMRWLSEVQLEFFIFHQAIVKAIIYSVYSALQDWRLYVPVLFVITLTVSLLYHEFLDQKARQAMRWTGQKVKDILL